MVAPKRSAMPRSNAASLIHQTLRCVPNSALSAAPN